VRLPDVSADNLEIEKWDSQILLNLRKVYHLYFSLAKVSSGIMDNLSSKPSQGWL
jgi:hypothetical protein